MNPYITGCLFFACVAGVSVGVAFTLWLDKRELRQALAAASAEAQAQRRAAERYYAQLHGQEVA